MLDPAAATASTIPSAPGPRRSTAHLEDLCAELVRRLQTGEHLLLFGARGTGKSVLLSIVQERLRARAIPCGLAPRTAGLADVVDACAQAYPHADLSALDRRAIATRLRLAAERSPGVLLLDHVRELTTAMIGYLRLLRGGVLAALLCVDVDASFEQERARAWRRHATPVRMPLMPGVELRGLMRRRCAAYRLPAIGSQPMRQLLAAARGRVGWVNECAQRLREPQYWRDGRLHAAALCTDCEMALRGRPGPRLRGVRGGLSAE